MSWVASLKLKDKDDLIIEEESIQMQELGIMVSLSGSGGIARLLLHYRSFLAKRSGFRAAESLSAKAGVSQII